MFKLIYTLILVLVPAAVFGQSSNPGMGSGGGQFTDDGTVLYPTETGDDVSIGSDTLTNGAKLSVDGDDDQVQISVQANATQTTDVVVIEQSDGTDILSVDVDGLITVISGGSIEIAGNSTSGQATCVKEDTDGGAHELCLSVSGEVNLAENETIGITDTGAVNTFTFGNLDLLTTGTIRGNVDVETVTGTSDTLTAGQLSGNFLVYSNVGVVTVTLPEIADAGVGVGASFCIYDSDATALLKIEVDADDIITLDGTALDAGDTIDSSGAKGDYICLLAIDATTNWVTLGRSGTWVDGGAT